MAVDPELQREVSSRWKAKRHLSLGLATLVVLVFGVGVWSAFASISGAIVASAKLKVESERQVVQHPEGGVVAEILVKEGDRVEAYFDPVSLEKLYVGRRGEVLYRKEG